MFEDEAPVAWPAMPYRAKVFGSDGSEIGSAESLLGDEEADIFHGIVVKRGHDKKMVEIPATRVKKIFASGVLTDLDSADVATLQPYREEHWYHLGWGGLFRKHPEWSER